MIYKYLSFISSLRLIKQLMNKELIDSYLFQQFPEIILFVIGLLRLDST